MGDSGNISASAAAADESTNSTPMPSNPGGNQTAMALTAAGGITSIMGQLSAGKLNKSIADANASVAEAQATEATHAGDFAASKAAEAGAQLEARQRGAIASSGTVVGAGTNRAVLGDTEQVTAVNQEMIKRNAIREALGFTSKAAGDEMAGQAAESGARMGAISTLLNTGSQEWLETDPNFQGYRGSGLNMGR